jgi:broad specificity phosphatase PhoE
MDEVEVKMLSAVGQKCRSGVVAHCMLTRPALTFRRFTATIFLVRHGQSSAQVSETVIASYGKTPLTALGRQQAQTFANSITSPPGLIVSSPFVRAQETATFLHVKFPFVPFETWDVHEFTYLDPVKCFMTTREQRRPWREEYIKRCDPLEKAWNDAESFSEFAQRTKAFLEKAKRLEVETAYVFTHAYFIRLVQMISKETPQDDKMLMRKFLAEFRNRRIGNCEMIEF